MIVLPHKQGEPEWHAARRGLPTASEFAPFMIEQPKCRLTKAELQGILSGLCIEFKKTATNDELIALLPDVTPYLSLTETTKAARAKYLARLLTDSMENDPFEEEAYSKAQTYLDNDPWIRRGRELEPVARKWLADKLGREIVETGLILHDSREFGGSPDGLILSEDGNDYEAGAEIKCHNRERHLADLLEGVCPQDHWLQVHGCIAVTGLDCWHYVGYHPGLPKLHVVVHRDEFTDQLEAGLLALAEEKKALRAKLAALWDAEFQTQNS